MVTSGKNELYYETGKETILFQNALHREFSDRATNLLNFGVATSAAGVVVLNFRLDKVVFDDNMIAALSAWALAFSVLLFCCLQVLRVQPWRSFSSLEDLAQQVDMGANTRDFILWCLAENFREAAAHNEKILNGKATLMTSVVVALFLEIASVIFVIFQILSAGSGASPAAPTGVLLG